MCLTGMPSFSMIIERDCGVLNSNLNYESESCNKRLPYICKKSVNASHTEAAPRRFTTALTFCSYNSPFKSYLLKTNIFIYSVLALCIGLLLSDAIFLSFIFFFSFLFMNIYFTAFVFYCLCLPSISFTACSYCSWW